MAEFKARVGKYVELHKKLATGPAEQKKDSTPAELDVAKAALTARLQMARAGARHGDIFTPEVRMAFRRLLAPGLKGEDGRDAQAIIRDDAPSGDRCHSRSTRSIPRVSRCRACQRKLLLTLPRSTRPSSTEWSASTCC